MELLSELKKLYPSVKAIKLGDFDVYHYQILVPAFTFDVLVYFREDGFAIQLKARSGFNLQLAEIMLLCIKEIDNDSYNSSQVKVIPTNFTGSCSFDQVVFLPPKVAECFIHQSDLLLNRCAWIFPSFSGEFFDGDSKDDFRWRVLMKHGPRLDIVFWDRLPASNICLSPPNKRSKA